MRNTIVVSIVLASILAAYVWGSRSADPVIEERVIEVVDTIIINNVVVDTQYYARTVVREVERVQYIKDTISVVDTVEVLIPLDKYIFEQEDVYRAELTGYEVTLDKMEVFTKTIKETKVVKTDPKWGLGVQAGYGLAGPYIGIGVQYNIITF